MIEHIRDFLWYLDLQRRLVAYRIQTFPLRHERVWRLLKRAGFRYGAKILNIDHETRTVTYDQFKWRWVGK